MCIAFKGTYLLVDGDAQIWPLFGILLTTKILNSPIYVAYILSLGPVVTDMSSYH